MKVPESLNLIPKYYAPSSWWQHVPIAHWLVENLKPEKIVELGSHYGISFFAFCEAASQFSDNTYTYAIDTWEGDEQAGYYDDDVFNKVTKEQQEYHRLRSTLIRDSFDNALEYFPNDSIDLIHIDGLHTYEAVKHDFLSWLPKVKEGGTLMFHDWNVRRRDFGVWKLWEEIKEDINFKCIETPNGHGLGIATKSSREPEWHKELMAILPALATKGFLLESLADNKDKLKDLLEETKISQKHAQNLEHINREQKVEIGKLKEMFYDQQKRLFNIRALKECWLGKALLATRI
ncbi:conserved hypothetical protein [Prochlorococcus marinus str. MIT 9313]|uniref:Class I SAM-dependent methyltransferase n=1 Tax=Prochlorococcus marinus (strain MIT 9313) TaxID=74547 RepID=Q7V952_PROMM|nr:class I SAM-dependent methyltransferase [Prochlorococcus marinus]CAE20282.1 conserved hypothetical protein [Prochlorococcus marinus str. MIT 9313]